MPSEEKTVNGGTVTEVRLAAAIIDVAREMKRSVPVPRSAPYFGLDSDVAYDLSVLDSLSSRGIFRKYELVLVVRSGLGGTARWLSRRLGCRILGVDADVARTRAARILNDGAGMVGDVSFAAGECEQLPFRDRVFTHVWVIDPTPRERTPEAFREAFRVLRSGAHFAMQIPVASPEELSPTEEALTRVGFVDFSTRAALMTPPSQIAAAARARLRAFTTDVDALGSWAATELANPSACRQIFCRRP